MRLKTTFIFFLSLFTATTCSSFHSYKFLLISQRPIFFRLRVLLQKSGDRDGFLLILAQETLQLLLKKNRGTQKSILLISLQQTAMACPFVKIKYLNEAAGLSRIGVRIISLWIVQEPPKSGHPEMVLKDSQGDQIQVAMKKEEFAEWCGKLEQDKTYIMENFSIVCNEEKYKACNHPYKMFLIDVIGAVEKMPSLNQKMAAFCLKDLNLDTIQCTLWDQLGKEFMEFWAQQAELEMVVVILRHARIKEPQGNYPIALSNTYNNATKVFTNQDLVEIKEFKSRIGLKIGLVQSSLGMSQMSSYSQCTELDKFMYKAQPKTIADINSYNAREEVTCVTVGQTVKFILGKGGWYYDGCLDCTSRRPDMENNGPFTCKCDKYNAHSVPRYKLEIKVVDNKGSAKFVFWDAQCAEIIGVNAATLRNQMLKLGEDDLKSYPLLLDQMLHKTMALRVKLQPTFGSASVQRISLKPDMIQGVLDQICSEEGTSKLVGVKSDFKLILGAMDTPTIEGSKSEPEGSVQFPTQSLSATADHDPDMLVSVTPTKRVVSDEFLSQNIASAKHSSTKMTKTIKTE